MHYNYRRILIYILQRYYHSLHSRNKKETLRSPHCRHKFTCSTANRKPKVGSYGNKLEFLVAIFTNPCPFSSPLHLSPKPKPSPSPSLSFHPTNATATFSTTTNPSPNPAATSTRTLAGEGRDISSSSCTATLNHFRHKTQKRFSQSFQGAHHSRVLHIYINNIIFCLFMHKYYCVSRRRGKRRGLKRVWQEPERPSAGRFARRTTLLIGTKRTSPQEAFTEIPLPFIS
jgi:hypothetical protein